MNYYWLAEKTQSWALFWEEIKAGKKCTWMRNTGVSCSCYMCSGYYKYKRPTKSKLKNNISKDISLDE